MTELRILGIGSPFGDDRLGWDVVKLLEQKTRLQDYNTERLQFMYCDRPGLNLLELMRGACNVFLIDAVKTGSKTGTLHCLKNQEIETVNAVHSSHAFGIAHAIEMGKILNLLPQNVVLYGIEMDRVRFQFELSKPIKHAIEKLAIKIESDIFASLR